MSTGLDCGVDTIEINGITGVKVIPQGCEAVSEDTCKSGFMAPVNNITFPEGVSVAQCCKCKPGEVCAYCKNKEACTDEEKKIYVSEDDNCFSNEPREIEAEDPETVPLNPTRANNADFFDQNNDESESEPKTDSSLAKADAWVKAMGLNMYGDPKDTTYTGGTPLFNESTGESIDRYEYIKSKYPNEPWLNWNIDEEGRLYELVDQNNCPAGQTCSDVYKPPEKVYMIESVDLSETAETPEKTYEDDRTILYMAAGAAIIVLIIAFLVNMYKR